MAEIGSAVTADFQAPQALKMLYAKQRLDFYWAYENNRRIRCCFTDRHCCVAQIDKEHGRVSLLAHTGTLNGWLYQMGLRNDGVVVFALAKPPETANMRIPYG